MDHFVMENNMDELMDDAELEAAMQSLVNGNSDPIATATNSDALIQTVDDPMATAERSAVSPSVMDQASVCSNTKYTMTGRPPQMLYISCDGNTFSAYQQLLRKQIEFFEADEAQVKASAQGRNKPIVLGQVGIRCRHCAMVQHKSRGSIYFPAKLDGIYQMAQNMAASHFVTDQCVAVPGQIKEELIRLKDIKTTTSGTGKIAWAAKAQVLGVYEDECGLRYTASLLDGMVLLKGNTIPTSD